MCVLVTKCLPNCFKMVYVVKYKSIFLRYLIDLEYIGMYFVTYAAFLQIEYLQKLHTFVPNKFQAIILLV